ncbi:MAG: hypothetical protein Ct9H300mP22_5040 [Gammaproteobacteria bacterium]|nr:MAG: hypothetical protein Ct9H300mP22_5040 [Gammaproteobacteria bacterium]
MYWIRISPIDGSCVVTNTIFLISRFTVGMAPLVIRTLYKAQEFLDVESYTNVVRWAREVKSVQQ